MDSNVTAPATAVETENEHAQRWTEGAAAQATSSCSDGSSRSRSRSATPHSSACAAADSDSDDERERETHGDDGMYTRGPDLTSEQSERAAIRLRARAAELLHNGGRPLPSRMARQFRGQQHSHSDQARRDDACIWADKGSQSLLTPVILLHSRSSLHSFSDGRAAGSVAAACVPSVQHAGR